MQCSYALEGARDFHTQAKLTDLDKDNHDILESLWHMHTARTLIQLIIDATLTGSIKPH